MAEITPALVIVVVLFFISFSDAAVDVLDNHLAEEIETNTTATPKSRAIHDFYTHTSAYKTLDWKDSKCYLERMHQKVDASPKKDTHRVLITAHKLLTKQEVSVLGGPRISEFCRAIPTFLLQHRNAYWQREEDVIAYKTLEDAKCFIVIIPTGKSFNPLNNTNFMVSSSIKLSKQSLWNLGGSKIVEFCNGFTSFALQPDSDNTQLNVINDIPITSNKLHRVVKRNIDYKLKSQTQSQYLNIGGSSQEPGKAEAEATRDGTKAVVIGNSGMGQAQSQSSPLNCQDCIGYPQISGQPGRIPGEGAPYTQGTIPGAPGSRPRGQGIYGGRPGDINVGQPGQPGSVGTLGTFYRPGDVTPGAPGSYLEKPSTPGSQIPGTYDGSTQVGLGGLQQRVEGTPGYRGEYGRPGAQVGQPGGPGGLQQGVQGTPGYPGAYGGPGTQVGQPGGPGGLQQGAQGTSGYPGEYGRPGTQVGQPGGPGGLQQGFQGTSGYPGEYGRPGAQVGQPGGPGGLQQGFQGTPGYPGSYGGPGTQVGQPGGIGGLQQGFKGTPGYPGSYGGPGTQVGQPVGSAGLQQGVQGILEYPREYVRPGAQVEQPSQIGQPIGVPGGQEIGIPGSYYEFPSTPGITLPGLHGISGSAQPGLSGESGTLGKYQAHGSQIFVTPGTPGGIYIQPGTSGYPGAYPGRDSQVPGVPGMQGSYDGRPAIPGIVQQGAPGTHGRPGIPGSYQTPGTYIPGIPAVPGVGQPAFIPTSHIPGLTFGAPGASAVIYGPTPHDIRHPQGPTISGQPGVSRPGVVMPGSVVQYPEGTGTGTAFPQLPSSGLQLPGQTRISGYEHEGDFTGKVLGDYHTNGQRGQFLGMISGQYTGSGKSTTGTVPSGTGPSGPIGYPAIGERPGASPEGKPQTYGEDVIYPRGPSRPGISTHPDHEMIPGIQHPGPHTQPAGISRPGQEYQPGVYRPGTVSQPGVYYPGQLSSPGSRGEPGGGYTPGTAVYRPAEYIPGHGPIGGYIPSHAQAEIHQGSASTGEYISGQRPSGGYIPGQAGQIGIPGIGPAGLPGARPGEYISGIRPTDGYTPGIVSIGSLGLPLGIPGQAPQIYLPGQGVGVGETGRYIPGGYIPGQAEQIGIPGIGPTGIPGARPGEYISGIRPTDGYTPGIVSIGSLGLPLGIPGQAPQIYLPGQGVGVGETGRYIPGGYIPGQAEQIGIPGIGPTGIPGARPGEYISGIRPTDGYTPGIVSIGSLGLPLGIPGQAPQIYLPGQDVGVGETGRYIPGGYIPGQAGQIGIPGIGPAGIPGARPGEYISGIRPTDGYTPGIVSIGSLGLPLGIPGQAPQIYLPGQGVGVGETGIQLPSGGLSGTYVPGHGYVGIPDVTSQVGTPGEYIAGQAPIGPGGLRPGEYILGQVTTVARPGEFYPGQPGIAIPGGFIPGQTQPGRLPGQQEVGQISAPGYPAQIPGQYIRPVLTELVGGTPGYIPGATRPDDDSDSQVQTSVQQLNNKTQASASSQGKYLGGTAQSQVTGTYSGSGSFSASSGTIDQHRGAQTQVSGGAEGALSSAQGRGGAGQSQAQVQLSSQTGDTTSSAQSGGINHGTNTQVQAGGKGGMADAQANGKGSTSSQANIGFLPYNQQERGEDNGSVNPFGGGGTASAQSGANIGQSQAQLNGKYRFGIKYTGSAQASSSNDGKNIPLRNISTNQIQDFKLFDFNKPTFPITSTTQPPVSLTTLQPPASSHNKRSGSAAADYSEEEDEPDEEYEEDYIETESKKKVIIPINSKHTRAQKQYVSLGNLEDLDATVIQTTHEDRVYEPGQMIPGTEFAIPSGLRGRVISTSGQDTYAQGSNSQAQTVHLNPGTGKVTYVKPPIYTVTSNTHLRNGQGYGSGYTYQPQQYQLRNGESYPRFVSSTRSETGSKNIITGKKTPSVYYSQSSTCGYFTNSCMFSNGKKVCIPKPKLNPDGTPMIC